MSGPGYASPLDAVRNGPREKVLYVTCPRIDSNQPDQLCTLDVDPQSKTYGKVIARCHFKYAGDECHHFGWNACSSCHKNPNVRRSHLVLPCLNSSRIYIVDVTDEKLPRIERTVEPKEMFAKDVSFGHTSHCLASGDVMISTLGDRLDNAKGSFLLLDAKTFDVKTTWGQPTVPFGYDYWYQPFYNIMVSTSWGSPSAIKSGFDLQDVENGQYGHELYVWKWKEQTLWDTVKLDPVKGSMPLEIRFLHDPKSKHGFVGCALGGTIYHLHWDERRQKLNADLVVELKPWKVNNWMLPEMPALITDILVSMDDRFLYVSTWLWGDLLQYDITNPAKPKLVGTVRIGGSVRGAVTLADGSQPAPTVVQGRQVYGGTQMLQLSLDGKRMYVTTSLYTAWDKQFYPELKDHGASLVVVDVDTVNGGMRLNPDLHANFSDEFGPVMCHEMRYPGGDCSSDIWLAECCKETPKI